MVHQCLLYCAIYHNLCRCKSERPNLCSREIHVFTNIVNFSDIKLSNRYDAAVFKTVNVYIFRIILSFNLFFVKQHNMQIGVCFNDAPKQREAGTRRSDTRYSDICYSDYGICRTFTQ